MQALIDDSARRSVADVKSVYVCGPMTGIPDYNFPLFMKAAAQLRERGLHVENPAENDGGRTDLPRGHYMRQDILKVLAVDAVIALPGWEKSQGAVLEIAVARAIGIMTLEYRECECPTKFHTTLLDYETMADKIAKARGLVLLENNVVADAGASQIAGPPAREPESGADMLIEGANLIQGGRRKDYGHPLDDFTRTADAVNSLYFDSWIAKGGLDAEDIPKIMILVKCSREVNRAKYDNRLDGAGYFGVLQEIIAERDRRYRADAQVLKGRIVESGESVEGCS